MEKDVLRNQLFDKYFEVEGGVLARDLVSKLSFVSEVWRKLHSLCEKNIEYFFDSLDKIQMMEHCGRRYLILKIQMWDYVIIDIEKRENISDKEFRNLFDVYFFIEHFDESKKDDDDTFAYWYHIENYEGDIQELIDFYMEHLSILCLTPKLYYELQIGNAWTYFCINFIKRSAQMGFQTPDQSLYDQLWLEYDLTPSGMQDAHERIGRERMYEMFEKIKDIKIPKEVIPEDLYQLYLERCERENKNCKCLKKDI